MKRKVVLKYKFVEYIPTQLKEGEIYISVEFGTVVHKCCCGCGSEVVTPLSPTDWKLTFDGESITLYPSIGNWNLACKSHYWIKNNRVNWAEEWSGEKIDAGRRNDYLKKKEYYSNKGQMLGKKVNKKDKPSKINLWSMLKKFVGL